MARRGSFLHLGEQVAWLLSILFTVLAAPVLVVLAGLETHYRDEPVPAARERSGSAAG